MSTASRDDNFVTTLLAVSSVDGITPVTLYANPTTHRLLVDLAGGGSGTVQTVAVATANGFAGTSDGNAAAPTLTLTTTITGIINGNGTAISAVTIGSGLSYDGTTLSATGGGSGDVVGPASSTDNAITRYDSTTGKLIQNSSATLDDNGRIAVPTGVNGGLLIGDTNYITEQSSADFLDIQRVGTDYTLARIKAPVGSSNEATLALLIDVDEDNSGVNEEFVDFYNEKYDDSVRAGIRVIKTGTGVLKPFVIGAWDSVTAKDAGDGLIVFPYDAVVVQNSLNVGQEITDSTVTYSRFGLGTTSHSQSVPGDVLVSGILEVNGNSFLDANATVAGTVGIGTTALSTTALLVGGSGYTSNLIAATGSISPGAGTNGTLYRIAGTIVEAGSGTHNLLTSMFLGNATVTGGTATVNNTASLFIEGAMTATVTGANYAIWSDDGVNRFDGSTIFGTTISPQTNDGAALGSTTLQFSDLFLAEGGVINWDNGDVTMTQTGNVLAVSGGDLQVATAGVGTNADSVPTLSSTSTFTNKRITKRTGTTTSSATPTINTDNVDEYYITAQTVDITSFTTNLSGTPTEGQMLFISVVGTAARAITWGASFGNGPVALPTTTVTTTQLSVLFKWSTTASKWLCYASGSTV
jgi:hypothetical protein